MPDLPQGVNRCCGVIMVVATTDEDTLCDVVRYECRRCERLEFLLRTREDDPPTPREATQAAPGSAEKIAVMRERAARGEHLYHPLDNFTSIARRGRGTGIREIPEGIHWVKSIRKYRAQGRLQRKRVSIGVYETVAQAVEAIQDAYDSGLIDWPERD